MRIRYLFIDPKTRSITKGWYDAADGVKLTDITPFKDIANGGTIMPLPLPKNDDDWSVTHLHDIYVNVEPVGHSWWWCDHFNQSKDIEIHGPAVIVAHSSLQQTGGKIVSCRLNPEDAQRAIVFNEIRRTEYHDSAKKGHEFLTGFMGDLSQFKEDAHQLAELQEIKGVNAAIDQNQGVLLENVRVELKAERTFRALPVLVEAFYELDKECTLADLIVALHRELIHQGHYNPSDFERPIRDFIETFDDDMDWSEID